MSLCEEIIAEVLYIFANCKTMLQCRAWRLVEISNKQIFLKLANFRFRKRIENQTFV